MGKTILLIEDNEHNRYLATYMLDRRGFRVVSASNGAEGIALARAEAPALVLLDIQLPGMNGYDVARALRHHAGLQQVPIIAVTSCAMAGDREKALEAGCTGYIEKPIDPGTFVMDIEAFLPQEPS